MSSFLRSSKSLSGGGDSAGTVVSTATAVPPHRVAREEVKTIMRRIFAVKPARLDAMMAVIDNSQIRQRYFIHPVEYIIEPRPLAQLSREYQEHSICLGRTVATDALTRAGLTPSDIDLMIRNHRKIT